MSRNRINQTYSDVFIKRFSYIFLVAFALMCLYPLVLTLSVSFSSEKQIAAKGYSIIPRGATLNTYVYLFAHSGKKIARSYGVTLFITTVGTLGALLVTSMIAFAISIKTLKLRNVIAFICNFTLIFPAGLIPWYIICVNMLHLKDTVWAMILPGMFSVWNMFLLRTYFSSIPVSLYESARVDGASWFTIFFRIAVPVAKTSLLTVGLMYALQYWNDWWYALIFVRNKAIFPLQYYLYSILSNVNAISSGRVPTGAASGITLPSETVKMAVTVITIGPIIFLYPMIQKYFVYGIAVGSVKE